MKRVAIAVVLLLCLSACGDDKITAPTKTAEIPAWAKVAPEQIAEAKKHGVPVAFENDVGMRFVLIPAGTFLMGSPEDEEGRADDETQLEVTLTRPYYMQTRELTHGQWYTLRARFGHDTTRPDLPVGWAGEDQPMHHASWYDALHVAEHLSRLDEGHEYFLPTEAQWEFACRAGTSGAFSTGMTITNEQGNFLDGGGVTVPVASFPPSAWGLYDMHGNMSEWCFDWIEGDDYNTAVDPTGPFTSPAIQRAVRGGGHSSPKDYIRCAARGCGIPSWGNMGFRLISSLPLEKGARGHSRSSMAGTYTLPGSRDERSFIREFKAMIEGDAPLIPHATYGAHARRYPEDFARLLWPFTTAKLVLAEDGSFTFSAAWLPDARGTWRLDGLTVKLTRMSPPDEEEDATYQGPRVLEVRGGALFWKCYSPAAEGGWYPDLPVQFVRRTK